MKTFDESLRVFTLKIQKFGFSEFKQSEEDKSSDFMSTASLFMWKLSFFFSLNEF